METLLPNLAPKEFYVLPDEDLVSRRIDWRDLGITIGRVPRPAR